MICLVTVLVARATFSPRYPNISVASFGPGISQLDTYHIELEPLGMASCLDRLEADADGFAIGAEHDAPFGRAVFELDLINIGASRPNARESH